MADPPPVAGVDDGTGFGVQGTSAHPHVGVGVEGQSAAADGVLGTAETRDAAGVRGVHKGVVGSGGYGVHGSTKRGLAGVRGDFDGGSGVESDDTEGAGVRGDSGNGPGLAGTSRTSDGVIGRGPSNGVRGESGDGTGVSATAHSRFPALMAHNDSTSPLGDRWDSQSVAVAAISERGHAVYAETKGAGPIDALTGITSGPDGHGQGVVGQALGAGMGVLGRARDSYGVAGFSGDPHLEQTTITNGPTGRAGVFGASETGPGVVAYASSDDQPAIFALGGIRTDATGGLALEVTGDMKVSGDIYLPGADCAEYFPAFAAEATPAAGSVLVIGDGDELRACDHPYDHRVAGVVAGHSPHRTAIRLGAQENNDGRVPIALVGRVVCLVDADYGPIGPGDLLTTSSTPAHAMAVGDDNRARGSILGKALKGLASGRGVIPILVCLQ